MISSFFVLCWLQSCGFTSYNIGLA